MVKYFFYYIIALVISVNLVLAENQDWNKVRSRGLKVGKLYEVSSGTGFYVTPSKIVTSAHVVENCLTISVRGAVKPSSALLLAEDAEKDLALLTTDVLANDIAYLRDNMDLRVGENLFIVGYPSNRAREGMFLTKQAQLLGLGFKNDDLHHIEFTSVIERGNSGGPVIDSQGNIVGVVEAKRKYYAVVLNQEGEEVSLYSQPFKTDGMATGLTSLKNFLQENNVDFKTNISKNLLSNYNPSSKAEHFVVNIHCVRNQSALQKQ